ncbi:MAG: peptidoglycan-binding protein [Oscillospiraceae bacterium]|jgi:peptidoglycan hydrolase-like protein with peptidoglycan-binding domain|nr:peptidoglycan-binding protein [Oscillospiraceae bacterium]
MKMNASLARRLRWVALGLLLLGCLPVLSGCFIQPDRTLDPLAIDQATVRPLALPTALPLPTAAPTPAPTATPQSQGGGSAWESWGSINGEGQAQATATPRPASSWQTNPEDYNAGYPVLKVGSTGADVSDMQERLKELGYYTGSVDGKFSSGTQDAVMAFQAANGLSADGVAGRATQDKLYSASAVPQPSRGSSGSGASSGLLKSGSSGTEVRKLQVRLAELGYYSGGADGIFGSSTANAVKAFQRANGLSADGQAGSQTLSRLYGNSAKPASSPVTTADPNAVRTLKVGMEGNDVYSMQKRLIELLYLGGVPDAVFGQETEAALRAFQSNNGLTADGVAGPTTQKKLAAKSAKPAGGARPTATPRPGNYAVLREGDAGEYVYDIQERLYDLGYYTGRIDGRFGAGTTAALLAFQRANGLDADGIAGSATQKKLFSSSAAVNPSLLPTARPKATPAPTLRPDVPQLLREGDSSEAVLQLQIYLTELGYFYGRTDGRYGASTTGAVRTFQRINGLNADGIAGTGTLTLLYSGNARRLPDAEATPRPDTTQVLTEGAAGAQVQYLQARLYQLYYLDAPSLTNVYDADTVQAVMAFQQHHGLQADGVAGPSTLDILYGVYAEALSTELGGND